MSKQLICFRTEYFKDLNETSRIQKKNKTEVLNDILKEKFKHKVIYNPNNTDRTIKIGGKVPDWFVFASDKCYIIEYFGLNLDRNTSHNSRIEDYKERTEGKIEIYEQLDGYGKVFIFPDDLKDNFSGLMEKIKLIH